MQYDTPDLVVSAMYLPDMTGAELVESMRDDARLEAVPFMLISSEGDQSRLSAVQQAGVSGICDKPFDTISVKQIIRQLLAA